MGIDRIDFAWPEGKSGALTTSWDDGTIHDRRLVAMMNRYGIKGTWNLNSSSLGVDAQSSGWKSRVSAAEVASLYAGHEVAAHSATHPSLSRIPDAQIRAEMLADRAALERLVGYPVTGMALPNGAGGARVRDMLRACGFVHCRPVTTTQRFDLPEDFMDWLTTCHDSADLPALWTAFNKDRQSDKLFYLWGHSYEFDDRGDWDRMEAFCKMAGETPGIWHATNMEICRYVTAWRSLVCTLDMSAVENPSGVTIWFRHGAELRQVDPGRTVGVGKK